MIVHIKIDLKESISFLLKAKHADWRSTKKLADTSVRRIIQFYHPKVKESRSLCLMKRSTSLKPLNQSTDNENKDTVT